MATYMRAKRKDSKKRTVSGYTKQDGTTVEPYMRRKRKDIRTYRTVKKK